MTVKKKISVIIVDDEPLALERIRTLLNAEDEFTILAECENGRQAVEKINKLKPDLLFLDIQMPGIDGFQVLEKINKYKPVVIFVTAYDKYAIKAFDMFALDYLLKPFDKERFQLTLERAKGQIEKSENNILSSKLEGILNEIKTSKTKENQKHIERFVVKSGESIYFINAAEIDWFEANGNYVNLYSGSKSHLIRNTLTKIEDNLDPGQFLRIHRSIIVNINSIKELQPQFSGKYYITLKNGTKLVSGKSYNHSIKKIIEEF